MKAQDPKVVNPRYAGATLDEVARTVFRASHRQATKVARNPRPSESGRKEENHR